MRTDAPDTPSLPRDGVEMPRPTVAPLVLAVGVTLLAVGVVVGPTFLIVGAVVFTTGLGVWIGQLLPGRGHVHEPLVEPARRAAAVQAVAGSVPRLRVGMPGYRLRLPVEVHPISAGVKGGIVGGLVMPVPALLWGAFSGHGVWYPVNLLAGMVVPGLDRESIADFSLSLLLVGAVIHAVMSVGVGVVYGVLMPTLPELPKPLAWGGLLMPLLWTAATFLAMGAVNPLLQAGVDWPWFILSQFLFGVVAALVLMRTSNRHPLLGGVLGGIAGGLVMPVPALLWGGLSGHGVWYPVNLLAGTVVPGLGALPTAELEQYHASWLLAAVAIHAVLSVSFGFANGLLLPRVPAIPASVAWGGLVMPLVWSALSYGLMGVANPLLQKLVDWPWFVVSQFIFGITAAIVVLRSELIHIPPAGRGPDRAKTFVTGEGGAPS